MENSEFEIRESQKLVKVYLDYQDSNTRISIHELAIKKFCQVKKSNPSALDGKPQARSVEK